MFPMLQGYTLVASLIVIVIVVSAGEFVLPAHGLLTLASAAALIGAVVVCVRLNPWMGLGLLVIMVVLMPMAWAAFIRVWPKTPAGRRLVLAPPPVVDREPSVRVGQQGVAISDLRPMGLCEFDGRRMEAQSEQGIVKSGVQVKVVALVNRRPTVRAV